VPIGAMRDGDGSRHPLHENRQQKGMS
jgi:hypothetical protein